MHAGALGLLDHLTLAGFGAPIILGGHFATFNASRLLVCYPLVDFIVCGEGEETFVELIAAIDGYDRLKTVPRPGSMPDSFGASVAASIPGLAWRRNGQVVINTPRPLIRDLDCLPPPDIDILAANISYVNGFTMTGSRGCFGRCGFCSVQSFYSPAGRGRRAVLCIFASMSRS